MKKLQILSTVLFTLSIVLDVVVLIQRQQQREQLDALEQQISALEQSRAL